MNTFSDWLILTAMGALFGAMFAWGGINQW